MGFLTYEQLIQIYLKELESNYNLNSNKHPVFSILKNSFKDIAFNYSLKYITIVTFFITPLVVLMLRKHSSSLIDMLFALFTIGLFWTIFYIIQKKFLSRPYIHDLRSLNDRVLLVREKVKDFDYSLDEVKQLIINATKLKKAEIEIILQRYFTMIEPTFTKLPATNEYSSPVERMICLESLIEYTKIPISIKEKKILIASLLRIGDTEIDNHNFYIKLFNKILQKEELKDNEVSKLNNLKSYIENSIGLLSKSSKMMNLVLDTIIDKTNYNK